MCRSRVHGRGSFGAGLIWAAIRLLRGVSLAGAIIKPVAGTLMTFARIGIRGGNRRKDF
jgi:hypothetical protein